MQSTTMLKVEEYRVSGWWCLLGLLLGELGNILNHSISCTFIYFNCDYIYNQIHSHRNQSSCSAYKSRLWNFPPNFNNRQHRKRHHIEAPKQKEKSRKVNNQQKAEGRRQKIEDAKRENYVGTESPEEAIELEERIRACAWWSHDWWRERRIWARKILGATMHNAQRVRHRISDSSESTLERSGINQQGLFRNVKGIWISKTINKSITGFPQRGTCRQRSAI